MDKDGFSSVGRIFARVRSEFSGFFLIHAVYTALGFTLFAPLMGALGQLMINVSSRKVLADTDILFFLLSPYGITAMLVFSALLITISIFEVGSMMLLYAAGSTAQQTGISRALAFTAARSVRIFQFAVRFTVRLALIVLPFLAAAGIVAWLTLSRYDINYYLSAKPPIFWLAVLATALIAAFMIYVLVTRLIDWSLTLPLILFKDVGPAQSFATSRSLVAKKKGRTAATLFMWAVGAFMISLVVFGTIRVFTYFTLPHFYDSMKMLLVAIGILVLLWSVANFSITAMYGASFSGLLIELLAVLDAPVATDQFHERRPSGRAFLTAPRLLSLAVIGAAAAAAVGYTLLDDIKASDDLIIVAHRGAAGKAPENTMEAISAAIEDGTDWVEIDVQESGDGHVVVVHDSDFMKLAGTDLKVWEGTLEEIQAIDVGSWFSPDFSDERVPLLADVLKAAKGRARVVIELKYYGHDKQLEQRVIDIVEEMGMADSTAIMSLKYDGIRKVRQLRPEWIVGLLSAKVLGNMSKIDADFLAVNTAMAKPAFIRTNQEAGKKVFVWTVNDKMDMFKMMSLGVDGIITDEPALARQVAVERAGLSSPERLLIQTAVLLGKDLPRKTYRDESP